MNEPRALDLDHAEIRQYAPYGPVVAVEPVADECAVFLDAQRPGDLNGFRMTMYLDNNRPDS